MQRGDDGTRIDVFDPYVFKVLWWNWNRNCRVVHLMEWSGYTFTKHSWMGWGRGRGRCRGVVRQLVESRNWKFGEEEGGIIMSL